MEIAALLSGFVRPIIDGLFQWQEGKTKVTIKKMEYDLMMKNLEAELQIRLREEMRKPESTFRMFILDFEGKASEQPAFIRIMRSSVRPFVTYWSLVILTALMFGWVNSSELTANLQNIPREIWWIFLAIFGFWFGGRAAQQVAATWKRGDVQKEETKIQGEIKRASVELKRAQLSRRVAVEAADDFTPAELERAFDPLSFR
jgi:hypothetical protein